MKHYRTLFKVYFGMSKPTHGSQCNLTIMGNSASNVVEENSDFKILFKEVGKIAAGTGSSFSLLPEGYLTLLHSLQVYHFEKDLW